MCGIIGLCYVVVGLDVEEIDGLVFYCICGCVEGLFGLCEWCEVEWFFVVIEVLCDEWWFDVVYVYFFVFCG